MRPGEQQVAETIDGIRADHVARYKLAAEIFGGLRVADIGCGVGYGSKIMADNGCRVRAIDVDEEAIAYGKQHYADDHIAYAAVSADNAGPYPILDAAVMFECIEHMEDPLPALNRVNQYADRLLCSVPNELVFPHNGRILYHYRHYTPAEFEHLLNVAGYEIEKLWGQAGPESDPEENIQGRTLIALCRKEAHPKSGKVDVLPPPPMVAPSSVAIVAMGGSCATYLRQCSAAGDRHMIADQTWAINSMGGAIMHDLLFHMDDIEVQERRAKAKPDSNVGNMMRWLKRHPRFFTSRVVEGYPGAMEYPLEAVIKGTGIPYMNSTVAYAVAYAMHIGVKRLSMFGVDYSYPDLHKAERGRGCVEFWLGMAAARGMQIVVAEDSTLLDACVPIRDKLYGYDAYDLEIKRDEKTGIYVEKKRKDDLPTAEEIEKRYLYQAPKQEKAA